MEVKGGRQCKEREGRKWEGKEGGVGCAARRPAGAMGPALAKTSLIKPDITVVCIVPRSGQTGRP